MTTFGGDILRMLARGGIETGANVGLQFLGDYLKNRSLESMLGTKTNLEAASVESNPEVQQQILGQLKDKLGLATVINKGMVPIGENPTMANLGQKKNLTYPEATYTPGEVQRIVAPVPTLSDLKSKLFTSLSTEEQKTAAFPKDASLQAALIKAQGDWKLRESEGEANRLSREGIAQMAADNRAASLAQTQAHQSTMVETQRERLDQQRKLFGVVTKKMGDTNLIKHSALVNQAWDDYEKAASSKVKDPARVAAAVDKYNNLIGVAEQSVPELAGSFSKLTPEMVQTWGEWYNNQPGTKIKGYTSAPKGTTPAAKQDAPSNTPPTAYLINYKSALAANANNPEAVAEIQRRAKSRYPNHSW
jgi:hypothetical protein